MALHQTDMTQVPAADDLVPEGPYEFRISKVNENEGQGSAGGEQIVFVLNIQTEGPAFGRAVALNCDMDDPRGRSNCKTVYKACGYQPGPEGHDPERVLDGELKGTVKHNRGKDGNIYANLIPWSLKPIHG